MLQEFNVEIKDKKGTENLVGDHLSRIIREGQDKADINDSLPGDQLIKISHNLPW